jgi:hypothetical protein
MKVFWSWQSDTPGKTGRHFVKDALEKAIEHLKQDPEITEPSEREEGDGLHLDQDIQGVPGFPNLADTILKKVDASLVFVADLTCVGQVLDNDSVNPKKLINSNVAIELGYALKSLTDRRVIVVFNKHYGSHTDMPFDLRHKGGAVTFTLAPDADAAMIKSERGSLASRFANALRVLLAETKEQRPSELVGAPSTYCKAAYFERGEIIGEWGEAGFNERIKYSYINEILFYVRLVPKRPLKAPLQIARLKQLAKDVPVLGAQQQSYAINAMNRYGPILLNPGSHPRNGPASISSSFQLFRSGEAWCIGTSLVRMTPQSDSLPWINFPHVGYGSFEGVYRGVVRKLLQWKVACTEIGAYQLLVGISGAEGLFLTPYVDHQIGPIHVADVESEPVAADKAEAVEGALVAFFTKLWDEAGEVRPSNYN